MHVQHTGFLPRQIFPFQDWLIHGWGTHDYGTHGFAGLTVIYGIIVLLKEPGFGNHKISALRLLVTCKKYEDFSSEMLGS